MTNYGPWKIWNGGECPVADDVMGQAQSATQSRVNAHGNSTPVVLSLLRWFHISGGVTGSDIVAYREVIEPEVDHATSTHKMYWHHKVRQAYNIPFIGLSCGKLFAITIQGDSIKAEWVE